jgi:hypothetical protein
LVLTSVNTYDDWFQLRQVEPDENADRQDPTEKERRRTFAASIQMVADAKIAIRIE